MTTDFYHGLEIVTVETGARPVKTVRSGIIAIIGTAPEADAETFPLDTPVLLPGTRVAAELIGATGTLPAALDAIFDQVGAMVVVVRVAEGADEAATLSNIIGGGGENATANTGVHAFKSAESLLGVRPKILIAPGFSHEAAVVTEMISIADQLRAVILADCAQAAPVVPAAAVTYAGTFGSKRVFVLFNPVQTSQDGVLTEHPASSVVAGLIARIDSEKGWWWSPSNQTVNVPAVAQAVDFAHGGGNSTANYLNENNVNVILRDVGFRLWGNRTCSADPMWQFLAVVRAHDMIFESVEAAHRWAIDAPVTKILLEDVAEGINRYLRHLKALGAILGGKAYPDQILNSPDQIQQGKTYVNVEWTPVYPNENMTLRTLITDEYIQELF